MTTRGDPCSTYDEHSTSMLTNWEDIFLRALTCTLWDCCAVIEGKFYSYFHWTLDIPSPEDPFAWFACFDLIYFLGCMLFVVGWVVWP